MTEAFTNEFEMKGRIVAIVVRWHSCWIVALTWAWLYAHLNNLLNFALTTLCLWYRGKVAQSSYILFFVTYTIEYQVCNFDNFFMHIGTDEP